MRRLFLLIACAVCVLAFAPQAQAQFNPGGVFNVLTNPLRGLRRIARPPRFQNYGPQRAAAARRAQRAAAARNAAPAAAAATAGVAAGAATVAIAPDTADAKPESKADIQITRLPAAPAAFWPAAHEDLIGYLFWPGDYDDRIWAHGFADITNAVFAPRPGRATDASAQPSAAAGEDAEKICREDAPAGWSGRIAKALSDSVSEPSLTDPQRASLADLERTIADAMKSVRSACIDIVKAPAAARMQTMLDRL